MPVNFTVENGEKNVLNKNGILQEYQQNFPAFEFNSDGSYKGLLVERQSTNLCPNSENIAIWKSGNLGSVLDAIKAPDGNTTADKLGDNSSGGTPASVYIYQDFTELSANTQYTASVFLKEDQLAFARLEAYNYDGVKTGYQYFGLSGAGILGTAINLDDSSITAYPDGWYRCSITWTQGATDTRSLFMIRVADSTSNMNVDLDGTSSIFVWGAQLEEGDKATSYIPTLDTTFTRTADNIYLNNASQYLPSSGTVIIKADFGESYNLNILGLSTSLSGEKEVKFTYSSSEIKLFVNNSLVDSLTGTYDFSGMNKIEIGNFEGDSQFNRHLQYFAIQ